MGAYMREHYQRGEFQRAGNTKTHGIVRGEMIVRDDLPTAATPRPVRRAALLSAPGSGLRARVPTVRPTSRTSASSASASR